MSGIRSPLFGILIPDRKVLGRPKSAILQKMNRVFHAVKFFIN